MKLQPQIILLYKMEDKLIGRQHENKERLAKIIAEIDVQAKGGFNYFRLLSLRYQEMQM